ncbi:hypothetical protein ASPZODRAFT_18581 [Penicilliopsis zonata CBS 506.65]|uniref:Uncharacterized protein n=1 Tax=Penicilliopsis zonata CBS 506.65 TaxID=1073090 RepID=A0A1L9SB40_9EURO|nr:hypothetical protein ASPZODRAFT_18581 [Penicilliopsis zonata CBS 506.65]OJJ44384.1 hypothetical protein ASPZODRAFT_18581 [Penicilliopsis zonata CBS 506.65]
MGQKPAKDSGSLIPLPNRASISGRFCTSRTEHSRIFGCACSCSCFCYADHSDWEIPTVETALNLLAGLVEDCCRRQLRH